MPITQFVVCVRLHIILAIGSMLTNVEGGHGGAEAPATVCLIMYIIKVVSHSMVVWSRWHANRQYDKDAGKIGKSTHRWYMDQEWFVSMTFNSFMMLIVMFNVEDAYKMKKQRRSRDKNGKIRWKPKKLGLFGVFARIGKAGKKDLWASYVM